MKSWIFALTLGVAAAAGAQSRSSFHNVTEMNDVFVTSSNGGLTLEVLLGAAPTLKFDGQTYNVTDLFGVWALDNNDDFSANGTTQNAWSFNSNRASRWKMYVGTNTATPPRTNVVQVMPVQQ